MKKFLNDIFLNPGILVCLAIILGFITILGVLKLLQFII